MQIRQIVIILFIVGLGFSCRKKKYPPELTVENDVVFYSQFNVDGNPLKIEGGKNDYYMYSSYTQDSNGVYNFIANLRQTSCLSNCSNSLKIQINDYRTLSFGANVKIDSSLQVKNYKYLSDLFETPYVVNFSSSFNKVASSYNWDFGDGGTSNLASPTHTFKSSGKYRVCLTVGSSESCYSNVCNIINLNKINPVRTSVSHSTSLGNSVSFFQNTLGGKAPYKFLWSFGDNLTDTVPNPIHQYSFPGAYPVVLRVVTANYDTTIINYNVNTASDGSSCSANYKLLSVISQPYSLALSNVIITWIDGAGKIFTSDNALQPASSYFEVLSIENYDNNENRQATKKLRIKFRCNVYNGTNVHLIENGEATICVAYK